MLSNIQNIAFFGLHGTFDFRQIGGTDSFFRRLACELTRLGKHIAFVHYGCQKDDFERPEPQITIYRHTDFQGALDRLCDIAGPVLVNAVHRRDRLRFIRFRHANKDRLKFYFVASLFPESSIKRNLYLLEAALYPYNGAALCMSRRLTEACKQRRNKARLLLPPVPGYYYRHRKTTSNGKQIVVTYIGRPVPQKGIDDAIEIFKQIHDDPRILARVYSYVWSDGREDESLHNRLLRQKDIEYTCEQYKRWSPAVDRRLAEILQNTDILLLPYKRLSSTIDTPLLMLEAMAAGCCVLTKPLGNIPDIYGDSPFIIPEKNFVPQAIELIRKAENNPAILEEERKRLRRQTADCDFSTPSVANKLIEILE